jgi:hypothetical protein
MAVAREKGEATGAMGQPRSDPPLEELLENLNLKGETIESVFVAKKDVESLKEETMRFAWAPAKEVHFRDLEENWFIVQAQCLRD